MWGYVMLSSYCFGDVSATFSFSRNEPVPGSASVDLGTELVVDTGPRNMSLLKQAVPWLIALGSALVFWLLVPVLLPFVDPFIESNLRRSKSDGEDFLTRISESR